MDAFGIPFVGFPVQRRKRPKAGEWGQKPVWIEKDDAKAKFRVRIPNVRSWAVGVSRQLSEIVRVSELPQITVNPKDTPNEIYVRPVVGGNPESLMTLDHFRDEWPLMRTSFLMAQDLLARTNPAGSEEMGIGPTFEELLEVTQEYVEHRIRATGSSDLRDVGIYFWRQQAINILETAIRNAGMTGTKAVPILGTPNHLDTEYLRRFQWTGIAFEGKKSHTKLVPCHTDLERQFAQFLDSSIDVLRYFKNERFGFSITYYENNRPRQYYPDFIVVTQDKGGREFFWLAETKGEIRHNTHLKREAAILWSQKMSTTSYGSWRYLLVQQRKFENAVAAKVKTFAELVEALAVAKPGPQLVLIPSDHQRAKTEAFKKLLPLYSIKAAAGYFGRGEEVSPEAWIEADGVGRLDDQMFVARAIGRSMEPGIHDGDYCVFRANPAGTRQGKIVLAQYRGVADPETGGAYTVKRYSSEKLGDADGGWKHSRVTLSPLNQEFAPIVLTPKSQDDLRIVAEFLSVLE